MTAAGASDKHLPPRELENQAGAMQNILSGHVSGNMVQAHHIDEVKVAAIPIIAPVPRELPPAPIQFVNRRQELASLDKLVASRSKDDRVALAVLNGMGGVGKTATAVHWAHCHQETFKGGVFYADLAMYRHRGGVNLTDVLGAFLRALGVHEDYLPHELATRASMFRSRTARSHVLVVLDNVDQAAEVRPLMPSSSGSVVLVTSRRRLGSLTLDGAELIDIAPLNTADSSALIVAMLSNDDRPDVEPIALGELIDQCAGLPIALRLAGARLIQRRRWSIAKLVGYLSDERNRLKRLSVEGQGSVQSVLDLTYGSLPSAARKVYRCLGLHPGPDVGVSVVGTAARVDRTRVDDLLESLCEANLLEESSYDRYRFHDLVRIHARQVVEKELKASARERITRDIIYHYLLGASAADHAVLGSTRWRLAHHNLASWATPFDAATAMDWFMVERMNLVAAVRAAAERQWSDIVWQFCESLWAFYYSRKFHTDWIESHQLGIQAALEVKNLAVEARMRNQLARAYIETGMLSKAEDELDAAWIAARQSSMRQSEAVVLESMGVLLRSREDYVGAIGKFQQSREINHEIGNVRGVALQLYHIGDVFARQRLGDAAIPVLNAALDIFGQLGDEMSTARTAIVLGSAYEASGRFEAAHAALHRAAEVMKNRQQPVKEAQALEILIRVARQGNDMNLFRSAVDRLLVLYRSTGSPRLETVREWANQRGW